MERAMEGVDCHSVTSTYLPGEARIGLQSARAARGEPWLQKGKVVANVGYSVEEAFNLTTILGARAAKMAHRTGSIAVGKFADIVLFKKSSPAMACASTQNPVAAIILHSSPADVATVIVHGLVRKRNGVLLPIDTDQHGLDVTDKEQLHWKDVHLGLMKSMDGFQKRIVDVDMELEMSRAKAVMYGANCEDIVHVD